MDKRGRGRYEEDSYGRFGCFFLVSVIGGGNQIEAADKYPLKPITIILPYEVGADADVIARPIMQKASVILGKPVVIVNKPGGGQMIGLREIYGAKPDGYTIGFGNVSIILSKIIAVQNSRAW